MDEKYEVEVDGERFEVKIESLGDGYELRVGKRVFSVKLPGLGRAAPPKRRYRPRGGASGVISSTIPGKVVTVEVSLGQQVAEGDICLVLEAMKMQNEIAAPITGRVTEINCSPGSSVEANLPLVVISPLEDEEE